MIRFEDIKEIGIPKMNGGEGITRARMFVDGNIKIMLSTLDAGSSIGEHVHNISSEIVYVISGEALCTLNGNEEIIREGECHYCPKGSLHSIKNNSDIPLVIFAVVPEVTL